MLGIVPVVDNGHPLHATDRACRSARLLREVLPLDIRDGITLQRNSRMAALLRAVVHQPVLANIEVAGAGSALPVDSLRPARGFPETS